MLRNEASIRKSASCKLIDRFFQSVQNEKKKKSANARRKTGPGVGLSAEGFFRLDFLFLLYQDKRNSPAAMSGENILLKHKLVMLRNEASIHQSASDEPIYRFFTPFKMTRYFFNLSC